MTTPRSQPPRKPLHPLGAAGLILFAVGLTAWAWTGNWRWAITGVAALLVLTAIGAARDGRSKP
ncbi:MAG TPA: hypothetical protein VGL02_27380 [Streptomyces sp.]